MNHTIHTKDKTPRRVPGVVDYVGATLVVARRQEDGQQIKRINNSQPSLGAS